MFKLFASAITLSLFTLLSACGGGSDTTAGNGVAAYAGHYVGTVTGVTSAADSGTFEVTVDSSGKITGTTIVKSLPWTLSGTVDANGVLNMGLYSGSFHGHNWVGSIKANGAFSGTWSHANGDGVNGTFAGSKG